MPRAPAKREPRGLASGRRDQPWSPLALYHHANRDVRKSCVRDALHVTLLALLQPFPGLGPSVAERIVFRMATALDRQARFFRTGDDQAHPSGGDAPVHV